MFCQNCGNIIKNNEAYCAKCGKMSNNINVNKGILLVKLDKMLPIGISLTTLGIIAFLIFMLNYPKLNGLFGVAVAAFMLGIIFIAKTKEAISSARLYTKNNNEIISNFKCKYCNKFLPHDVSYCTLCGSKQRNNLNT